MKSLHPKTIEILEGLKKDTSDNIIAATYTWAYGRSYVTAAFTVAVREGIIVKKYRSCLGNWVYSKA